VIRIIVERRGRNSITENDEYACENDIFQNNISTITITLLSLNVRFPRHTLIMIGLRLTCQFYQKQGVTLAIIVVRECERDK